MGPNDPFATVVQPSPSTAPAGLAGPGERSSLERRATIGALAGALLAMIGVLLGPGAAAWVLVLGAAGAAVAAAAHLGTSPRVRAWLVRMLDDRA